MLCRVLGCVLGSWVFEYVLQQPSIVGVKAEALAVMSWSVKVKGVATVATVSSPMLDSG